MKLIKANKINKVIYLILVFLLFFNISCSEDQNNSLCTSNEDCSNEQVCKDEACIDYIAPIAFEVTGELYEIGNPTDGETLSLELINRARSNPSIEGKFLNATGDSDVTGAINFFKVNMTVVMNSFTEYSARPPIAFNAQLNQAALATSTLMKDNDTQAHTINGISFDQRINNSGYSWSNIGENIFAYSKNAVQAHAGFNIDWGNGTNGIQSPPGHRNTIMGVNTVFKEVGISILTDIPKDLSVGPMIVAQDFGIPQGNRSFITGVVYNDLNGNRFYDLGEGIGGVTISTENGSYKAITTDSGAYSLPITQSGLIRAQAFATDFPLQIQDINLSSQNYKLDFNIQRNGANGDASVGFDSLNLLVAKVFEAISGEVYQQAPTNVTFSR